LNGLSAAYDAGCLSCICWSCFFLPDADRPVIDHGFTHICVAVDDAVAECARLEAKGVRLHCPVIKSGLPVAGTYGRDPDGNVFEILEICDPNHPLAFANRRLAALKGIPP